MAAVAPDRFEASVRPAAAQKPRTCQMFETPLIERFSRIHPSQPFLFWVPVLIWRGYTAAANGVTPLAIAGLALAGLLAWTFTEYMLHRYLFHYTGPRPWQRRMYFVLHGVHHDFPQDADRLVMPLGASIPIGAIFYVIFRLLLGSVIVDALFLGFGIGYLTYDGMHYAVHHFRMSSRLGRWLKRYHMVHHHAGVAARWGVSSPLWDWVFGTLGQNDDA
jgi:sterol desaturase/sphingolipid hydroxylase (fatty acid hydroxylase superfamily)